jgi:REP element-mobilizing transposase RayT
MGEKFLPLLHLSPLPRENNHAERQKPSGPSFVDLKSGITKWRRQNTEFYNVWQRNYYEHIVRDEPELNRIRQYIIENPLKWQDDKYFQ